ncbi:MAG: hypothetical protein AB7G13_08995 [Lautropia sp.]
MNASLRPIDAVVPLAALAIAIAIRMLVIQPAAVGQACDVAPWDGWCAARTALVLSFRYQEFGWFALAVGVLATWLRRRWLGHAALALGLAGLVLYSYEPAVVAALLGALVVARPRAVG